MTVPVQECLEKDNMKRHKSKMELPCSSKAFSKASALDGYLRPFEGCIRSRYEHLSSLVSMIEKENEGGLDGFSQGYQRMGFIVDDDGIIYREWAPGAKQAFLIGDFSIK